MQTVISRETWYKFSEKEQEDIIRQFNHMMEHKHKFEDEIQQMIRLFGEEVLHKEYKIKTWDDVRLQYPDVLDEIKMGGSSHSSELLGKCEAVLKIDKLIELGYGGRVTLKNWKQGETAWSVIITRVAHSTEVRVVTSYYALDFITFHTKEQADEFISYPENVELVKQYYCC